MANRSKGWAVLNHRRQLETNQTRRKVEKVVTAEGDFLYFQRVPEKRLIKGWNVLNFEKMQRRAIHAEHAQNPRPRRRGFRRGAVK